MTPFGLNITTSRCRLAGALLDANPKLGKLSKNGTAAAPTPRFRKNSRRDAYVVMMISHVGQALA
jgi:hypothetical protein